MLARERLFPVSLSTATDTAVDLRAGAPLGKGAGPEQSLTARVALSA
jgi:hypothetical protein